jgi:hypothetical protein
MSALQICQLESLLPSLGSPAKDVCSLGLSARESASLSVVQLMLSAFRSIINRVFFLSVVQLLLSAFKSIIKGVFFPVCSPAAAVCFQVYYQGSFLPFLLSSCCCLLSSLSSREFSSLSVVQLLLSAFKSIIKGVFFPVCSPAAAVCFQVYHRGSFLPFLLSSCCCLFSGLS